MPHEGETPGPHESHLKTTSLFLISSILFLFLHIYENLQHKSTHQHTKTLFVFENILEKKMLTQ